MDNKICTIVGTLTVDQARVTETLVSEHPSVPLLNLLKGVVYFDRSGYLIYDRERLTKLQISEHLD